MSFDKTKAMRNAERYLSQGKIRAAIGEYKQIVDHDPKDFSTLNILGDLHTKNAEKKEAVACFSRVAEYYGKQGFAQKAIAVYNKIARLEPHSLEVSAKLAELYQAKGSFAEARVHYTALAEQFERKGDKIEALSVWKQIAGLDPNNTEVYLKIAESYLEENQKDEAADAFTVAGERLSAQNDFEAALATFSRTLDIRPNDFQALNGFVKAQISLGYTEEAAKTLEQILEKQPYNRDILYLLVDCHLDTGNPQNAEKAVVKLVEQEPANYPKFLELIDAYLKINDLDSGARILAMSSEHLLVGGQSDDFLKWTNEILARNPEQIEALRLLVRYHGWQRDEGELKQSLDRLAECARLVGLVEDERNALSQLVMIVPYEAKYAQRLQEINTNFHFEDSPYEAPLPTLSENVSDGALEYVGTNESAATAEFSDYAAEAVGGDFQTGFALVNQFEGNGTKDFEFVANSFEARIAEEFNEDEYDSFGAADEAFDESFIVSGENFGADELSVTEELSAADEMKLEKELESIEFYVAQGYKELAEKSLTALEEEFGARSEFAALREQMDDSLHKLAAATLPQVEILDTSFAVNSSNRENGSENIFDIGNTAFAEEQPVAQETQKYDSLDDFRSDLGLEENEPAKTDDDYETHYHTAIAYKEMGLMEDSIREFQDAINLVSPNDGTRRFFACAHLLGHCFMEKKMPNLALMWYKRALETSHLSAEEKQGIWYEIGNAYEIGGDSEKALENFEMVYAVNVDYRDVSARLQNLHVNC